LDDRLPVHVFHIADLADVHAVDLHVEALREVEGGGERDPHVVGLRSRADRPPGEQHRAHGEDRVPRVPEQPARRASHQPPTGIFGLTPQKKYVNPSLSTIVSTRAITIDFAVAAPTP